MRPFFIVSPPRAKAGLLARMLDAKPGVRCAGDSSGMLAALRKLEGQQSAAVARDAALPIPLYRQQGNAESWAAGVRGMLPAWLGTGPEIEHAGVRTTFLGREGWREACDWWSWLLQTWPDARIVFVGRDQGEIELSMMATQKLWRPAYGTCAGVCGARVKQHLQSMRDFHELNPTRTVLIDAAELENFDVLSARLGDVGIPVSKEAWAAELSQVIGSRRELAATLGAAEKPKEDHPAFDPAASYEDAKEALARAAALEAFKADPFGDKAAAKEVRAWKPRQPWRFRIIEPQHKRAIVCPWLSKAAKWSHEELRYALRSWHVHFTDRECPIYILGDRPPEWFRPGGRVRFVPIDYSRGQVRGLREAFVQGLQLADEVLWANDDFTLLQPVGWSDFRVALRRGKLNDLAEKYLKSDRDWLRTLGTVTRDLQAAGIETVWNFATHTPFLFERAKAIEVLQRFHLRFRGSFETLYYNFHHTPHRRCGERKTMTLPAPPETAFLNHNDRTLSDELKAGIAALFPEPAPWELSAVPIS